MGEETNPHWVNFFGWLGVLAMIVALVSMIVFYFIGN
jgi:Mn2+/Fe2+ NRAMP family transporter